jgi:hypothetical protein
VAGAQAASTMLNSTSRLKTEYSLLIFILFSPKIKMGFVFIMKSQMLINTNHLLVRTE